MTRSRRRYGAIRKLPSGRYQARYRDGFGTLQPAPDTFATKGEAERWLGAVETDQARGTFIDPRAGRTTVDAWAEEWLRTKRGQRANTLARDRAALAYLRPVVGHMPLSAVTAMHIRSVHHSMAHLSPKSRKTYFGTIGALFAAAVEADLIARTPVRTRSLDMGQVTAADRPTLTAAQLLALADEVPPRYSALVLVSGALGLRWSEVIALRVKDVDFLRKRISVMQTVEEVSGRLQVIDQTKSAASRRTMTAPDFVIEALSAHLAVHRPGIEPDSLIFVGERGGVLRRSFRARYLRPAVERAGLSEALNFHGLRHVAATLMVETNEHPRVVQERLGHAHPGLSMRLYAHVPDGLDQTAAQNLDALLRRGSGTEVARRGSDHVAGVR